MKKIGENSVLRFIYANSSTRAQGDALAQKVCAKFGGAGIPVGKKRQPAIYLTLIKFIAAAADKKTAEAIDADMRRWSLSMYVPTLHIKRAEDELDEF